MTAKLTGGNSAPGRVVILIADAAAQVWGMAYKFNLADKELVAQADAHHVFTLDLRS